MPFTHLHVHSNYSYGMGSSTVESLIAKASAGGYESLAITDHNTMVGTVEFYSIAKDYGIRPLIGCEIDDPKKASVKAVLLCTTTAGYERLCALISGRQLDPEFDLIAALKADAEGLIILSYSLELLASVKGKNLYGELVIIPAYKKRNRLLYEFSVKNNLPMVVTNDVYFSEPEDFEMHHLLSAMKNLSTVYDLKPIISREQYLKSPDEMRKAGSAVSDAVRHTEKISKQCRFEFTLKKYHCAKYRTEDGKLPSSGYELLRQLSYDGLQQRYHITPKTFPINYNVLHQRLQYELEVIGNLNFCDYFLICRDIINFAHRQGYWHVGRGSAANSLVSYCLGLTEVDPIRYHLYFERFLNYARGSPPDIDLDFSWRHRDAVLRYIYERYGEDKVAMMSSVHTLHARGALREVAKAFGVSEKELDTFRKFIPHTHADNLNHLQQKYPEARDLRMDSELYQKILRTASRLEGFPNYSGIHSSGVVITEQPITHFSALERSANGFVKTQLDMYSGEDTGLIKFDILAVRGLGTLEDACRNIEAHGHEPVDLFHWPKIFSDEKAQTLMRSGKTIGVVHAESPFIRNALRITQAQSFELLYIILGMVRTGCVESGMMYTFIERLLHPEKRKEAHQALVEILPETFGVMIFEEDVIKVLHFVGNLTLEEADVVRRCMSGKRVSAKVIQNLKYKFFQHCVKKFPSVRDVEELWKQIESFSGFSFCKAHSASYALMAFQGLYLKIHYPAEYMAAVLSNQGGFYSPAAYISECRRTGLKILAPDINRSLAEYSAEENAIRIGLRFIGDLSAGSLKRIFTARAEAPYVSLEDFVMRAGIEFEETVNLIKIGCFDFLNKKRTVLISKLDALRHIRRNRLAQDLLPIDLTQFEKSLDHLGDMTLQEKLMTENRLLGYFIHQHPLEFFAKQVDHPSIIKAKDLSKYKGKKVKVIGWLVSAKRIRTRDKKNESGEIIREGEYMKFMTMEDLTDIYDAVLFPKVYEKAAAQTLTLGAFCLEGVVDARYNTINVTRIALIKNHLPIHDDAEPLTIEKQEIYARQKAEGFSEADGIVLIEIEPVEYQIVQAS